MITTVSMLIASLICLPVLAGAGETLKLATTTSTYETGLLEKILPPFEKARKTRVHVISVGTGKALKLGRNGDVDLIMVHAREAEDEFVAGGYGVNRRDLMYNDFVILGPRDDPARIAGQKDIMAVFRRIHSQKSVFVSRGDDSGTHKKEENLWKLAGLQPEPGWCLEAGQGMSATLRIADEKNAYVLVDRATYLSRKEQTRLELLVQGNKELYNPYGVIAVSPYRFPHVKYEKAMVLIAWLTSPECQDMINTYKKNGETLFKANAAGGTR